MEHPRSQEATLDLDRDSLRRRALMTKELYAYACYVGDVDLLSSFFCLNFAEVNVDPVLQAAACLEVLVQRVHPRVEEFGQAVELLEYIHSQCPDVCSEGSMYAELLLDMKTKAASYELLSPAVCGDREAEVKVLDKYFGADFGDNTSCTAVDEQSLAIQRDVRMELLRIVSSEQELSVLQDKMLNPLHSHSLHRDLVDNVHHYVTEVKQQLPKPLLVQHTDDMMLQSDVAVEPPGSEPFTEVPGEEEEDSLRIIQESPVVIQDSPRYKQEEPLRTQKETPRVQRLSVVVPKLKLVAVKNISEEESAHPSDELNVHVQDTGSGASDVEVVDSSEEGSEMFSSTSPSDSESEEEEDEEWISEHPYYRGHVSSSRGKAKYRLRSKRRRTAVQPKKDNEVESMQYSLRRSERKKDTEGESTRYSLRRRRPGPGLREREESAESAQSSESGGDSAENESGGESVVSEKRRHSKSPRTSPRKTKARRTSPRKGRKTMWSDSSDNESATLPAEDNTTPPEITDLEPIVTYSLRPRNRESRRLFPQESESSDQESSSQSESEEEISKSQLLELAVASPKTPDYSPTLMTSYVHVPREDDTTESESMLSSRKSGRHSSTRNTRRMQDRDSEKAATASAAVSVEDRSTLSKISAAEPVVKYYLRPVARKQWPGLFLRESGDSTQSESEEVKRLHVKSPILKKANTDPEGDTTQSDSMLNSTLRQPRMRSTARYIREMQDVNASPSMNTRARHRKDLKTVHFVSSTASGNDSTSSATGAEDRPTIPEGANLETAASSALRSRRLTKNSPVGRTWASNSQPSSSDDAVHYTRQKKRALAVATAGSPRAGSGGEDGRRRKRARLDQLAEDDNDDPVVDDNDEDGDEPLSQMDQQLMNIAEIDVISDYTDEQESLSAQGNVHVLPLPSPRRSPRRKGVSNVVDEQGSSTLTAQGTMLPLPSLRRSRQRNAEKNFNNDSNSRSQGSVRQLNFESIKTVQEPDSDTNSVTTATLRDVPIERLEKVVSQGFSTVSKPTDIQRTSNLPKSTAPQQHSLSSHPGQGDGSAPGGTRGVDGKRRSMEEQVSPEYPLMTRSKVLKKIAPTQVAERIVPQRSAAGSSLRHLLDDIATLSEDSEVERIKKHVEKATKRVVKATKRADKAKKRAGKAEKPTKRVQKASKQGVKEKPTKHSGKDHSRPGHRKPDKAMSYVPKSQVEKISAPRDNESRLSVVRTKDVKLDELQGYTGAAGQTVDTISHIVAMEVEEQQLQPASELSQSQTPYLCVVGCDDGEMECSMLESQVNAAPVEKFERLSRNQTPDSQSIVSETTCATATPMQQFQTVLVDVSKYLKRNV